MESRSTREQQPWSYSSCGFTASFAWPPRPYPCSFCKREFRSAQALGGHMNVHRRERAKLRHCSPPRLLPPPPPAANPRLCRSSTAAAALLPNLNYPPPPPPPIGSGQSQDHEGSSAAAAAVAGASSSLELGVGVCSEDDGLDLELRLGCS